MHKVSPALPLILFFGLFVVVGTMMWVGVCGDC